MPPNVLQVAARRMLFANVQAPDCHEANIGCHRTFSLVAAEIILSSHTVHRASYWLPLNWLPDIIETSYWLPLNLFPVIIGAMKGLV